MEIIVKRASSRDEIEDALKIREAVFIKEQNIEAELDRDGLDSESEHILAKLGDTAIGTARIRFVNEKAKIERLAVLRDFRRAGAGFLIIKFAVEHCKEKYAKEIYLHAQCHAKSLYEKLGFKPRGDVFKEADIDHVEMYFIP